MMSVA